jgi:capsular exopolysaccharide synthesis family protein
MAEPQLVSNVEDSSVDISSFFRLVIGRWPLILSITSFFTIITFLFLLQQRPLYTAVTKIILETRQKKIVDERAALSGLKVDEAIVGNEIKILESRGLAYKVIDQLNLDQDPEFNPTIHRTDRTVFEQIKHSSIILGFKVLIGLHDEAELIQQYPREKIAENVLDNLRIENDGVSYVIEVGFVSEDPEKSARIVNIWVDEYLKRQISEKLSVSGKANSWLNEQLEELKQKLNKAEDDVIKAKEKFNIIESEQGTIEDKRLTELNIQLVEAQANKAQMQARLKRAKSLVKNNSADSVPEVLASPLIQSLREKETDLRRKEAEMKTRYGAKHPKIVNVKAEISDLRDKIKDEVNRILKSMANELVVAQQKEQALEKKTSELEQDIKGNNRALVIIRQLEREANATRAIYNHHLLKLKESAGQDQLQEADAKIVSRADTPHKPSHPKTVLITTIVALVSASFSVVLIFLLEASNSTFRNAKDVETTLNLACVAQISSLNKVNVKSILSYIKNNLLSYYSESIRNILTNFDANCDNKVILITSSVPNEGKSFFNISLANIMGFGGKKVLVVDCDLRRPAVAKSIQYNDKDGGDQKFFSDYLSAKVDNVNDVIRRDSVSNVDYCFSRVDSDNYIPQSALGSERMEQFINRMRDKYDYILIDSPPVLAVSDSVVLSKYVDVILYAIRHEKTPKRVVKEAVAELQRSLDNNQSAKEQPIYTVLTQVNMKKSLRSSDSGSYYYRNYRDYYSKA